MQWKYNEDKILKDVEEYLVSTYGSHYCGHSDDYRDIQTIDLMAAKDLASDFCQANIIKYGSRYGDLIVSGCYIAFVWEDPDLQEFDRLVGIFIVFAVLKGQD